MLKITVCPVCSAKVNNIRENWQIAEREQAWIERIRAGLHSIPENEEKFIEETLPLLDESKFLLGEYGL